MPPPSPVHENLIRTSTRMRNPLSYLKDFQCNLAGIPSHQAGVTPLQSGDSIISCRSKKQHIVSRSFAEVEYMFMASLVCELIWLKKLISNLRCTSTKHVALYCDNKAAIHITFIPVFHKRTEHIEIDCHAVRKRLQQGLIKLFHVPSYM